MKPNPEDIRPGQTWEHITFCEVVVDEVFRDPQGKPFWGCTKTRYEDHPFGATRQPVGTKMIALDVSKFKRLIA